MKPRSRELLSSSTCSFAACPVIPASPIWLLRPYIHITQKVILQIFTAESLLDEPKSCIFIAEVGVDSWQGPSQEQNPYFLPFLLSIDRVYRYQTICLVYFIGHARGIDQTLVKI